MLCRLSPRWLIPLTVVVLLLPACSDSADDSADTTLALTTTAVETTTTIAPTTTTTLPPTTTTAATTTTKLACPDFPVVPDTQSGPGAEVEPGSYHMVWVLPDYSFTVADPTRMWLGERREWTGWKAIPEPAWHHPKMDYEDLEFSYYTFFVSYDGESEVELPEDPAVWLTEHPMLETTEPVAVAVDGHEGVQVDAIVLESHPDEGDWMRFAGNERSLHPYSLPLGAAIRFVFVEVDDQPLWFVLTSLEDGFDDAAAWADAVIASIEFC